MDEIKKRLPHRSQHAIASFASKCNLRKQIHFWTTTEDALLRKRVRENVPREQIAKELGLTLRSATVCSTPIFVMVADRRRAQGIW